VTAQSLGPSNLPHLNFHADCCQGTMCCYKATLPAVAVLMLQTDGILQYTPHCNRNSCQNLTPSHPPSQGLTPSHPPAGRISLCPWDWYTGRI